MPEERLAARLGVSAYDKDAPLSDTRKECTEVKLLLSQHIGAPAVPVVSAGDRVTCGTPVAAAADGLSAAVHASIDGTVREVTPQYIVVTADKNHPGSEE